MHARGLSPKTVFYQTNGTGRDTYISTNNGGGVKPSAFKMNRVQSSRTLHRQLCSAEDDSPCTPAVGSEGHQIQPKWNGKRRIRGVAIPSSETILVVSYRNPPRSLLMTGLSQDSGRMTGLKEAWLGHTAPMEEDLLAEEDPY